MCRKLAYGLLILIVCLYSFRVEANGNMEDLEMPEIEGATVDDQCLDLEEKMDIVIPLQESIGSEFATIKDKTLCNSMSRQCEYFYRVSKHYQKQYRNLCDKNFQLEIKRCEYSDNPCNRIRDYLQKDFVAHKY